MAEVARTIAMTMRCICMRFCRNGTPDLTARAPIILRGARLLLPSLPDVEFRPGNDLACDPALRPIAGADERRDRCAHRLAGARPDAAQPRRRGLFRSHRRPAHHARLELRHGFGGAVDDV